MEQISGIEESYSTRFAAGRAIDRQGLDPLGHTIEKRDGRFYIVGKPADVEPKGDDDMKTKTQRKAKPARVAARAADTARSAKRDKAGTTGSRAAILAAAQEGKLPKPPDFSARTRQQWIPKLAEVQALVKAGDIKALKAHKINTHSSGPKAIDRYRNLAVVALEARAT